MASRETSATPLSCKREQQGDAPAVPRLLRRAGQPPLAGHHVAQQQRRVGRGDEVERERRAVHAQPRVEHLNVTPCISRKLRLFIGVTTRCFIPRIM